MENGCKIEGIIQLISKKWALLIIKNLSEKETMRYNELVRGLNGISPKTLGLRLKELEGLGMIRREHFPEIPPRVEYSLTEKGVEFGRVLQHITEWSEKWGLDKIPVVAE